MKDYAKAPGSAAVILYRENNENDVEAYEEHYYRIKILTEAGKKYADVETERFAQGAFSIRDIRGRTIQPDGTIVPFEGKVFDKVVAKSRGVSLVNKTWTMPDVRVGSIIEYRYTLHWDPQWVYPTRWLLQNELPIRNAHFTFRPNKDFNCAWMMMGWSTQKQPEQRKDQTHLIVLDLEDMPAMEKEPYMPPVDELRARVEFFYSMGTILTGDQYWKEEGKKWRGQAEGFMDKRDAAQKQLAKILGAGDSPDLKLRRIYDAVQKVRNLSFAHLDSTEAEKLKSNSNIEDVLSRGYGFHNQLNRTFVALARAAGFDALIVRASERDGVFFHKELPQISQLSTELALVRKGGKELYFDPGTLYCPFGVLPWQATGSSVLIVDKNNVSFSETPLPFAQESVQARTAKLRLEADGTLTGTVQLSYENQDALERRLDARDDDDKQRAKDLEDTLKQWLPSNATVKLESVNDWRSSDPKLVVNFTISVPGFATSTGKRVLMPVSVFQQPNRFTHEKRVNPIYFQHAYIERDDVALTLGPGLDVENLPAAKKRDLGGASYTAQFEKQPQGLHLTRQLVLDGVIFPPNAYAALRNFYNLVATGDQDQAILKVVAP